MNPRSEVKRRLPWFPVLFTLVLSLTVVCGTKHERNIRQVSPPSANIPPPTRSNPAVVPGKSKGYVKCSEGNNYKFLTMCKKHCNGTVRPEDDDMAKKPNGSDPSKYSYKLIVLDKNEFKVSPDGSLLTELPDNVDFKRKYFTLGNNKAYLCLPMPSKFVDCENRLLLTEDEFELKTDGRHLWVPVHKKHYRVTEYAFEKKHNGALYCADESHQNKVRKTALITAWFLSLICLGLTIVLSQIFPQLKLKKNIILLCNFAMLFLAYSSLCIKLLVPNMGRETCRFMAHFQQYMFLSAFCWINVQAVDVFLRFMNLRVSHADFTLDKKKFILYSVHAWGTPLWITLITVIVEQVKVKYLNPRFSEECWFKNADKGTAFLYFYGPISIILFINTLLFAITVYKLCTIGKAAKTLKKGIKKQLFQVYLKLIIVMGLCWIMEIVSVGVNEDWDFPDMINALQGVFIFLVYVCKPNFMKKGFDMVCRRPGCPKWWPWKPYTFDTTATRGCEATASTTNSTGGTLPRNCQNVVLDKV